MKKAIIFIIVSMLMLTACNQTPPFESENAKKYQYFYFEDLDWGMSREECLVQLGVIESNTLPIDDIYQQEGYDGFKVKKKVYGYPAEVTCLTAHAKSNIELGLTVVYVSFEKDTYDITKVYHQWAELVSYSGSVESELSQHKPIKTSQSSPISISKIEDEILVEKANDVINQMGHITSLDKAPLSNSRFYHDSEKGATYSLYGTSAAILNYAVKQ